MRLTSPEFADGAEMPWRVTAANENRIPALNLHDVPNAACSLTILLEDLSSPLGSVTHWLVWNLPPETTHIDAVSLPKSAVTGMSAFGKIGYSGPTPPEGQHTYRFVANALDCELDLAPGTARADFDTAVIDHIIDTAELRGIIERS